MHTLSNVTAASKLVWGSVAAFPFAYAVWLYRVIAGGGSSRDGTNAALGIVCTELSMLTVRLEMVLEFI